MWRVSRTVGEVIYLHVRISDCRIGGKNKQTGMSIVRAGCEVVCLGTRVSYGSFNRCLVVISEQAEYSRNSRDRERVETVAVQLFSRVRSCKRDLVFGKQAVLYFSKG